MYVPAVVHCFMPAMEVCIHGRRKRFIGVYMAGCFPCAYDPSINCGIREIWAGKMRLVACRGIVVAGCFGGGWCTCMFGDYVGGGMLNLCGGKLMFC